MLFTIIVYPLFSTGLLASASRLGSPQYRQLDGLELLLESTRSPNGEPLRGADLGLLNPGQLGADNDSSSSSFEDTSVGDGKSVRLKLSVLCDADYTASHPRAAAPSSPQHWRRCGACDVSR
jgi:hypothetical protein